MTCSTTRPLPKPEGKAQRGKVSSARATPHRPIAWWAGDKELALDADACWEQILHHLCNPLRISHYHPRLGFLWQLLGSLKILFLECRFHLRGSKPQRTGRGNTAWPGSAITEDVMELACTGQCPPPVISFFSMVLWDLGCLTHFDLFQKMFLPSQFRRIRAWLNSKRDHTSGQAFCNVLQIGA